jgi:hypothetical protein
MMMMEYLLVAVSLVCVVVERRRGSHTSTKKGLCYGMTDCAN